MPACAPHLRPWDLLRAGARSLQATIGGAGRWLTGPSRAGGCWGAGAALVAFPELDSSC